MLAVITLISVEAAVNEWEHVTVLVLMLRFFSFFVHLAWSLSQYHDSSAFVQNG